MHILLDQLFDSIRSDADSLQWTMLDTWSQKKKIQLWDQRKLLVEEFD